MPDWRLWQRRVAAKRRRRREPGRVIHMTGCYWCGIGSLHPGEKPSDG